MTRVQDGSAYPRVRHRVDLLSSGSGRQAPQETELLESLVGQRGGEVEGGGGEGGEVP